MNHRHTETYTVMHIQFDCCLFKLHKHTKTHKNTLSLCCCQPKAKARTNLLCFKKYFWACVLILPGIQTRCFVDGRQPSQTNLQPRCPAVLIHTRHLFCDGNLLSPLQHLFLHTLPTRHLFCDRKLLKSTAGHLFLHILPTRHFCPC